MYVTHLINLEGGGGFSPLSPPPGSDPGYTQVYAGCTQVYTGCTWVYAGCTQVYTGCTWVYAGCTLIYAGIHRYTQGAHRYMHYIGCQFFFSPLLTSLRKENHLETLQDEGELIRDISVIESTSMASLLTERCYQRGSDGTCLVAVPV